MFFHVIYYYFRVQDFQITLVLQKYKTCSSTPCNYATQTVENVTYQILNVSTSCKNDTSQKNCLFLQSNLIVT